MSFGEELKNKADEVHLQEKAKDLGDAVAAVMKEAVTLAAGYAQQNRDKVDNALDKAEASIEQRTGGKHTDTVTKVRAQVNKGIDKLVDKNASGPAGPSATPGATGAPGTPGTTAAPGTTGGVGTAGTEGPTGSTGATGGAAATTPVPDDSFSAFDDDRPSGSPS